MQNLNQHCDKNKLKRSKTLSNETKLRIHRSIYIKLQRKIQKQKREIEKRIYQCVQCFNEKGLAIECTFQLETFYVHMIINK